MEAAGDVAAAWLRRLQEGGVEVAAAAELVL
jgi:transposase